MASQYNKPWFGFGTKEENPVAAASGATLSGLVHGQGEVSDSSVDRRREIESDDSDVEVNQVRADVHGKGESDEDKVKEEVFQRRQTEGLARKRREEEDRIDRAERKGREKDRKERETRSANSSRGSKERKRRGQASPVFEPKEASLASKMKAMERQVAQLLQLQNQVPDGEGIDEDALVFVMPTCGPVNMQRGAFDKNNQKLVSIRKQSKDILQYTDKKEVSDWLRTVENYLGQYTLNEGEYNTLVMQLLPLETSQLLADMIGPTTSTRDLYKRILLILGNPTKLDDRRRMFYEVKPGKKLHTLVDVIQELSRLGRTIFSLEEVNKQVFLRLTALLDSLSVDKLHRYVRNRNAGKVLADFVYPDGIALMEPLFNRLEEINTNFRLAGGAGSHAKVNFVNKDFNKDTGKLSNYRDRVACQLCGGLHAPSVCKIYKTGNMTSAACQHCVELYGRKYYHREDECVHFLDMAGPKGTTG